ncbi:tRNA (adenosine(37)-N6)-threonylcarbamoyltransferase complex ATPase subunit type 1 TsaE [Candidatus Azambacteria bacterium]|nr:tRNA (adenosine(37)-N6)-threonylcarbamoyltransferase complex ATPase subunit type 1 TsaE [Candidatus Azambacteria bacterium]
MKIITNNSKETHELARCLGQLLMEIKNDQLIFLALEGELGAGKTTFVQGLAKGLGMKEKILSPTFVLMKGFEIPEKAKKQRSQGTEKQGNKETRKQENNEMKVETKQNRMFYHLDGYRLKNEQELETINFKEILKNNNIVVMEWADKVKKSLPKKYMKIQFKYLGKDKREIKIS